jgi:flagellar biosynthesis protein FliR
VEAAAWAWLLVVARVAPIAWFAPPGDDASAVVRAALGLGLSALVASSLPVATIAQVAVLGMPAKLALVVREAAIGGVIAVVAAVPVLMADAAGRLADLARAGGGVDGDPLARLTRAAALVVFFGIGGPLAVARALADSYTALPLAAGGGPADPDLIARTASAAAHLIAAGMWIAVPWLVTGAIVELGAAAARRSAGFLGQVGAQGGARQVAVVAAVGLGAVAAAAVIATQIRAALALITSLWT